MYSSFRVPTLLTSVLLGCALVTPMTAPAVAAAPEHAASSSGQHPGQGSGRHGLRVATYNASLNRGTQGELLRDLSTGTDPQARNIAEVVQTVRPDVVLVNEFDHVPGGHAARAFNRNYLNVSQRGKQPVDYPYSYVAPVNTGVPTGLDLNGDGSTSGPEDAHGFGQFPGQYGMVIYSKYPIDTAGIRTFQHFKWQDMPGNVMPSGYYSPEAAQRLRLSSKSHWDVPVRVGGRTIHVLAAHPTPPSFDGPEDRNGRRNHDEIRFWADYVSGHQKASYIYDDAGHHGGLPRHERFVIVGDYNSDPRDGDSFPGAIDQLLHHPRVRDPRPTSTGAQEAARLQGGANLTHRTPARYDTADFGDDPAPGNVRVDYALPSRNLPLRGAGVFWPGQGRPGSDLTGTYPFPTSDHRLVWTDVRVPGRH